MNKLPAASPQVTLTEAFEQLLELTGQRVRDKVRSPATLEMQQAHRRYWERTLGPWLPLEQVDELVLERLANGPKARAAHQRPLSGPATLKKRLSTLRAVMQLQLRRRRLDRVPTFPEVLAPPPPTKQVIERYVDAKRLFESLPRHRAEWYWLALWTGEHSSDVERHTWTDIELERGTIVIRNTKNKRPELKVSCPLPLLEVLREMNARDKPAPDARLVKAWPSRKTTLPRHCVRLGLPPLNATALRHSCLSWVVRTTGITPAACRFAGHSTPAMMARTYAKALPPQLGEVTEALNSMAANTNGGGNKTRN